MDIKPVKPKVGYYTIIREEVNGNWWAVAKFNGH